MLKNFGNENLQENYSHKVKDLHRAAYFVKKDIKNIKNSQRIKLTEYTNKYDEIFKSASRFEGSILDKVTKRDVLLTELFNQYFNVSGTFLKEITIKD